MNPYKNNGAPPVDDLIIFPAFEIGYSELVSFTRSMDDKGLMDKILLICSPDLVSMLQQRLKHLIVDNFDSILGLIKKIESWAHNRHASFKGIIGVDEEEQFSISKRIAAHFGLEFYNDRTCALASNKFLLKTFFKKNRVPTGRFSLYSTFDKNSARAVGFPNILKVLSGNGSAYIFKNDTMKELKQNFNYLKTATLKINRDNRFRKQRFDMGNETITLDPKRQFLLEEFIPGEEFSLDFMKRPDDVRVIRVVKKFKGPFLGFFKGYLLLKEEDLIENGVHLPYLTEICRRVSKTFSIESGVCMMDFKIHHGKLKVIESSIRPGLSAFNHLMYEIYGFTSLALMAMQKIGVDIDLSFPKENGAIVYLYCSENEILYDADTSELEKMAQRYNILHIHVYKDLRETIPDSLCDRSDSLRGYAILKNPDPANLPEIADLLNEKVKYIERNK